MRRTLLLAGLLCALNVSFTACAFTGHGMETKTAEEEISVGALDSKLGLEGIADKVASVGIYEITENQFQKGIDVELNEEQLEALRDILRSDRLRLEDGVWDQNQIKYIVNLYDEAEKELAAFGIDKSGDIYRDKTHQIISSDMEALVRELTRGSE